MKNRALAIGISNYPPGIPKLPAVSHDVRAIADVLGSETSSFSTGAVRVLLDVQANAQAIRASLNDALSSAHEEDTVFIYLAGHGDLEAGGFYFIPFDARTSDLARTAIPLKEIKTLFDDTRSSRVLLWLDFCYSGGILSRAPEDQTIRDVTAAVERTLRVTQGHGKVIMCACTADQRASERADHGLFTKYLLNGLRGAAANAAGEVTASSLHDYIDREIGSTTQRPLFFGEMAGRIVLMHSSRRPLSHSFWQALASKFRKGESGVASLGLTTSDDRISLRLPDGTFHDETALVARRNVDEVIVAMGNEAKSLLDTQPAGVTGLRPLSYGVVADEQHAAALIRGLLPERFTPGAFSLVAGIPCGCTKLEKDALRRALGLVGFGRVFLIPNTLLAAIGAGLPIEDDHGFGVINVTEQMTEVSAMFKGHVEFCRRCNVGTNDYNAAIRRHLGQKKGLSISVRTAQEIMQYLGTGYQPGSEITMSVVGQDRTGEIRAEVTVSSHELRDISLDVFATPMSLIEDFKEACAVGLIIDVGQTGFYFVGRGGLIPGIQECFAEFMRFPFHSASNPLSAVITGTVTALDVLPHYLSDSYGR